MEVTSGVYPGQHRVKTSLENLMREITDMLNIEKESSHRIQDLERELDVYKRAYIDVNRERNQLKKLQEKADKDIEALQGQLHGFRVTILIDGDGAIFSQHLVEQGQAGGLSAARILTDSVLQYLNDNFGAYPYQLWVHIFFNRRGLLDTFSRLKMISSKLNFDDFIMGFNEASERFVMVDVGKSKEAADSKIKVYLEDELRLSQTFKVLFGGCHDNGYVNTLRSQITAGFKSKLVLLRSYTEMAAGISELDLPNLSIEDLFIAQKLVTPTIPPMALLTDTASNTKVLTSLPASKNVPSAKARVEARARSSSVSIATTDPMFPPLSGISVNTVATTYAVVAKLPMRKSPTPDLFDFSESHSDEDGSSEQASPDFRPTPIGPLRRRYIIPNIPLWKQNPPPCTLHYLSNCNHGTDCKYAHDYLLSAAQYTELQANAKNAPCPAVNKDEPCTWGEKCFYGHFCPQKRSCLFRKQGRCKFTGAEMHKEQTA